MTSSATQTETPGRRGERGRWAAHGRTVRAIAASLLLVGWLAILFINKWHVSAPVVFLSLGWLALVVCGLSFFRAAHAAAGEGTVSETEGFELSAGREVELEREKRALLKAIKEVEFDREMGKMSETDAVEITRVYRARAIEILKELEADGQGDHVSATEAGSLDQMIEREVRARLALAGVSAKRGPAKANGAEAKPATESAAETGSAGPAPETESESRTDPGSDSESPDGGSEVGPEAEKRRQA